eukprot:313930-Pelagomonas_calceolata.AAC.5
MVQKAAAACSRSMAGLGRGRSQTALQRVCGLCLLLLKLVGLWFWFGVRANRRARMPERPQTRTRKAPASKLVSPSSSNLRGAISLEGSACRKPQGCLKPQLESL